MADLEHLEQRLARLEQTVARLESRVSASSTPLRPATPAMIAPSVKKSTTKTLYPGIRWTVGLGGFLMLYLAPVIGPFALFGILAIVFAIAWPFRTKTLTPTTGGTTLRPTAVAPHQRSAFEQDLAKHWFSWLGIISLVVGVGLFLQYSLRSLGPIGNILTAYAVAAMLFGLWAWFRNRYRGFGFILQAGAWAIVYIATYAFQNVAGGPISSPAVAGVLLMAVVVSILLAALEQKSRTLTAGAFLLGFITAAVNTVDVFTLTSLVALGIGLAIVATIQRWPMLVLWGNLAVYIVHFVWMMNGLLTQRSGFLENVSLSAAFLIIDVLIFGAAHWLLKAESKNDRLIMGAGTIANLSGFFVLFQFTANEAGNEKVWLATFFLALVCALLAFATSLAKDRAWLRSIYIVFAVAFLAIATAQKFNDEARILGWLVEGAALVTAGALSGSVITRISGSILSLGAFMGLLAVLGIDRTFGSTGLPSRLVFGPAAILLYGTVAQILRQVRNRLRPTEHWSPVIWADAAIVVALLTAFLQWPPAWGIGIAAGIAAGMILLGIAWQSANGRWGGILLLVVTLLVWLAAVAPSTALAGTLNIHARVLSGTMLTLVVYGLAWWLKKQAARLPATERRSGEALAWLGLVSLNAVIAVESPLRLLSVYWGLIGIGLYIYGFSLKSAAARRQGLAIIALTILKVYLYDVRLLERAYQILSFFLLGGILLGIGFLYNRWRQNQSPKTPSA